MDIFAFTMVASPNSTFEKLKLDSIRKSLSKEAKVSQESIQQLEPLMIGINVEEKPMEKPKLRKSIDLVEECNAIVDLDVNEDTLDSTKEDSYNFFDLVDNNEVIPKKNFCKRISWQTALRISALAILLAGIGTFLGFLIGSNNVQTNMVLALEWISHLPKWGSSLLMIGMYCVALLLFCPGTPFNLASGYLFGLWIGCGVALGGCILGALFAFLLGRTIARDWVKSQMEKRPKFAAVDWAIQKNGIYIVFLTRLSPLFPFPLLNYAFGITKVRVWQYFLGTFAGVLPATLAYTYLGTLMRNLTDIWTATDVTAEDGEKKSPNLVWLIVGSILTLLSIIVISLITKRAIAKATKEYNSQNNIDPENEIQKNDEISEGDQIKINVELEEIIADS